MRKPANERRLRRRSLVFLLGSVFALFSHAAAANFEAICSRSIAMICGNYSYVAQRV
jgi:hypothetical protein